MTPGRAKELAYKCRSFEHALRLSLHEQGWWFNCHSEVWIKDDQGITENLVAHLDENSARYLEKDAIGGPVISDALKVWIEAKELGAGRYYTPEEMDREILRRLEKK